MDDLISRQAVLDAINSGMLTDDDTQFECPSECNSMLEWAVNAVKELPTAEKTGKWIPVTNGRGGHECDQCHEYAPSWQTGEERLTNYCPNCGARMEE